MSTFKEINAFYEQELLLLKQIGCISETIKELAQNRNFNVLEKALNKRENVFSQIRHLENISCIEKRFTAFSEDKNDSKEHNNIFALVIKILGIKKRVQIINNQVQTLINNEKNKVALELKKISNGRKIIKKYVPFEKSGPAFVSYST